MKPSTEEESAGEVTYEYEGCCSLIRKLNCSEALFDRADMAFMDVVFKQATGRNTITQTAGEHF
jgi:hypothetical protein